MARKALGPATLAVVQAVRATVSPDSALLVAVSGGADSLALAFAVRQVAAERRLPHAAITIDHGLQRGSAQQAQAVATQLADLGYDDVTSRFVSVTERCGPEADARAARYGVLDHEAFIRNADLVLGHNLDDQAETVLLGLTRGSGSRSLAGMPSRCGHRLRPLLSIRRQTTRQACGECGLSIWDDPLNDEPRFTRVRIRQSVMPLLETELGPGIADALARTADLARADTDLLDRLASQTLSAARRSGDLDCSTLAAAESALRSRAVKIWLQSVGATQPSYEQVRAVERLVTDWHGQGPVQLPGLIVTRRSGLLCADTPDRSEHYEQSGT
jgi:tRNA(Ile)-lysidine synthase